MVSRPCESARPLLSTVFLTTVCPSLLDESSEPLLLKLYLIDLIRVAAIFPARPCRVGSQLVHTACVLAVKASAVPVIDYCISKYSASTSDVRRTAVCIQCAEPTLVHDDRVDGHFSVELTGLLHAAVAANNKEMVEWLLAHGAAPGIRDEVRCCVFRILKIQA